MTGYRLWCFTNFDLEFDYEKFMASSGAQYVAWGDEVAPTTGKKHHQGFVYFAAQQKSVKKVSLKLGKCHVEPCKGGLADNEAYCSKEGSYHELGRKPRPGARTDLLAIKDEIMAGKSVDDLTLEDPMLFHQYGRTLSRLEDIALRRRFRTWMTEGIWLFGPTGVGKSHWAFEGYDPSTHYVWKEDNGWQDGYVGQELVIINDFRGSTMAYNSLLNLVDKWPYHVSRRGREPAPFLAKRVIITSSLQPHEVYKNLALRDSLDQLYRRFVVREILPQKCSEGNTETSEPFF